MRMRGLGHLSGGMVWQSGAGHEIDSMHVTFGDLAERIQRNSLGQSSRFVSFWRCVHSESREVEIDPSSLWHTACLIAATDCWLSIAVQFSLWLQQLARQRPYFQSGSFSHETRFIASDDSWSYRDESACLVSSRVTSRPMRPPFARWPPLTSKRSIDTMPRHWLITGRPTPFI